ncbi:NADPH-dependent pterin aldehyde reductase [Phtheirospermum japonicum]|uniref:NADPH-dependent pterin aldehyde reductase n=1 Tax=Phtheirospermum japonicum TaxID=374723 RepID=A0A830BKW4_9LAMI|nr:NADPH-dependent pterin aldehyde reductase [Phtheirospermum japonicum]
MTTPAPPTATNTVMNITAGAADQLRKVLITGVSRGLGKALALELAKRGHTVIGCSRSPDLLSSLQSELASASENKSNSNQHLTMNVDVRSNSSVEELARALVEKKSIPDIIVNNAGTINKNNRIWEVPADEFDTVIDTNIKGTANVLRHFLPVMVENKNGIIVNISSGWGRSAAAQVAPYCASKWAVEGLTKAVAKELPAGMSCVALNPGVINTEMLQSCFGNSADLYPMPDSWYSLSLSLLPCTRALCKKCIYHIPNVINLLSR